MTQIDIQFQLGLEHPGQFKTRVSTPCSISAVGSRVFPYKLVITLENRLGIATLPISVGVSGGVLSNQQG